MFKTIVDKIDAIQMHKDFGNDREIFLTKLNLFFSEIKHFRKSCVEEELIIDEQFKKLQEDCNNHILISIKMKEELELRDIEIKTLNKKIIKLEEDDNKIKVLSITPSIEENFNKFLKAFNDISTIKIGEFTTILQNFENKIISQSNFTSREIIDELVYELTEKFENLFNKNENIDIIKKLIISEISIIKTDIDKYHKYSVNLRQNSSDISFILLQTQKEIEKINKEKIETISLLEKQLHNLNKEIIKSTQNVALINSKFNNATLILKNIFNYYLDDHYQKDIEECFSDQDLNIEKANILAKLIKSCLYYKFSIQIMEYAKANLQENNKKNIDVNQMINQLNVVGNCLPKVNELISVLINYNTLLSNSVSNEQPDHSDRLKILEDTLKEKDKTIMNFIIQNEELLNLNKEKSQRNSDEFDDERFTTLQLENQRLKEQKILIKKQTEEMIKKVKNDLKADEFLVDKRIIGSFIMKVMDKTSSKNIRLSILDTLANVIGFNNEERKKLGLNPLFNQPSIYNPSSSEKLKEISIDLYNLIECLN